VRLCAFAQTSRSDGGGIEGPRSWWDGKVAEIDGDYFGGYVKPANFRENRRDWSLARNQNRKRRAVVIVRERYGNSIPAMFKSKAQAIWFIKTRVAQDTELNADEASGWMHCIANTRSNV
jgi:hypothetical protein